ncbi:putative cytochrome P450 superfamily [Helianthus debilis subsp. tardiflorus]
MAAPGKTSDVLELKTLIKKFFDMFTFFSVGSYVPWLSWVDRLTGLVGRAETVAKEFDEFLEGVIEEHVTKTGGEGAKTNEGQYFVEILLNVQRDGTTGFTFQTDNTVKAIIIWYELFSSNYYIRIIILDNYIYVIYKGYSCFIKQSIYMLLYLSHYTG